MPIWQSSQPKKLQENSEWSPSIVQASKQSLLKDSKDLHSHPASQATAHGVDSGWNNNTGGGIGERAMTMDERGQCIDKDNNGNNDTLPALHYWQ
jgi:hypothetical protein